MKSGMSVHHGIKQGSFLTSVAILLSSPLPYLLHLNIPKKIKSICLTIARSSQSASLSEQIKYGEEEKIFSVDHETKKFIEFDWPEVAINAMLNFSSSPPCINHEEESPQRGREREN
jgi:hypothetical protein